MRGPARHLWLVALVLAGGAVWGQQQSGRPAGELAPSPPPEGACAQDVISHVLTEQAGSWERVGPPVSGDMAITADLTARLAPDERETLLIYSPLCGAAVTYRNTEGPGVADVLMIAFEDTLSAIGFFASSRTEAARRVLLTSAAYRDNGVLHVYSCTSYFRVEVRDAPRSALPADQYIAARLEVRLPAPEQLPRIIRLMPRGWVNPLTVSYEPTDLFGERLGFEPMAAGANQAVGDAQMTLRIIEAADEAEALRWYTLLLQRALERGRAWEIARLGQEAFFSRNGGPAVIMLQDQFLAHLTTTGERDDAESVMRLVGTAIRTTRPLPDSPEGYCPPFEPDGS
ncbi:MAG: DUF6599 family protein [Armatimonadota bacterium]|jgi:hypothetical protein